MAQTLLSAAPDRRRGRPAVFPPEVAIEVKAVACELPSRLGVPLSRLFVPDIRAEVLARGLVAEISGTTIWRWLAEDAIRPWTHRSWICPRDPDFEPKASRVLDLYARQWQGEPLGGDEYVVAADEKTSIQCRCRCRPTLPAAAARGDAGGARVPARWGGQSSLLVRIWLDVEAAQMLLEPWITRLWRSASLVHP